MRQLIFAVMAVAVAVVATAADKKTRKGKIPREGRPGVNRWNDKPPGSTKPLPRPYPGAPPIVPHAVEGLVISRDANACLDCHLEGAEIGEGHAATKVPPSHFVNPRTNEVKTGTVTGTRYQCLQCHATTTRMPSK